MIIALNVGNTNVSYGVVEGHELTSTGHVATPTADRVYQIEMMLDEIIGGDSSATSAVNEVVLASVVPAVSAALHELATRRGFELFEADETTIPVPIRTDAAASAGNDRLVNAYAAAQLHGAPAIVVDLGTATTFDVVDAGGSFVGGAIAPGLGLGLDALATRTAQLPRVPIAVPARAIGQQTVEAIQSGAVLGHVGMVDYLVRAIAAELAASGSSKPKLVLTGGLSAHAWAKAISGVDVIDPLLTLRGLALLHAHARHPESVAGA